MSFAQRLGSKIEEKSRLCAGVDPHPQLLLQWGLSDSPSGLREFCQRVIEAVGPHVAAIKPQSAFFERFGSAGIAVLEELLQQCRDRGVISVLDVKRGDIGSTMAGYAQAYLTPQSPLSCDAITLSPYLGVESLNPAFEMAEEYGRGVFVLGLTSNPEGRCLQQAQVSPNMSVAKQVVMTLKSRNANNSEQGHFGVLGLVIGATVGDLPERLELELESFNGPILVPGIGTQGGGLPQVEALFKNNQSLVLAAVSRSILQSGPDLIELQKNAAKMADTFKLNQAV